MMSLAGKFARRFKRDETGHVTVEFAIMVPVFLVLLLSSVEAGMLNLRNSFLERALDVVVRDIRLGTGYEPTHDEIRDRVCEEAHFIPNCSTNLMLEMIQLNPRAWTGIPANATCTNRAEAVQPVTEFHAGESNELMILRACAKTEPLFPTTGLGYHLVKDSAGDVSMIAISAFVQEPK